MSVLAARVADRVRVEDRVRDSEVFLIAAADDAIRLSVGDPDLPPPPHIIRAAQDALQKGYTRYTHWQGFPALREAIAEKLRRDNALTYAPEEIVVTTGAEEALFVALMSLVEDGDEVLFADPYFHALPRLVKFAGGIPVLVPTHEADGFALRPEEVERRLTPRSKVLVLISPHNPTGAVLGGDLLDALVDLARRRDLLVISDEIYEKIVYDGAVHRSIASLPGMRERTVVLNGFSKAYSMTGFRLGYLAAPADMIDALHPFKEHLSICASSISQYAGLAAICGPQDFLAEYLRVYDERRRAVMSGLDVIGLPYARPAGGFFLFANISGTGLGSVEFCRRLMAEVGVIVFPGSMASSRDGYVRISWLQPVERLREGLARMHGVVERLRAARRPAG